MFFPENSSPSWALQDAVSRRCFTSSAGLARATRGRVLVDGNDLTAMSDAERTRLRRHKIGFIFQRFNLLPTLDASGNIAIAQHIHGMASTHIALTW